MSETTAPFTKPPSWRAILALLGWAMPFLVGAATLYLGKEFATHTEVRSAVAPIETVLSPLPSQVQSLAEFRARQDRAQEKTEAKFEVVQQSLATLAAQQSATDRKVDRVLDALDRMNRRSSATTGP